MNIVTEKWPFLNKRTGLLAVIILILGVVFFYVWRLGNLTAGLSREELAARANSGSFDNIVADPTYAPHKLLQLGFQSAGQNGVFWMRLTSVLFALAALFLFYTLLRLWFGRLIGILGTLLLAGTPLVVLTARSATPYMLLLTPISLLASYVWYSKTERKNLAWLVLILLVGLSLYTPGMIFFIIMAILIFRTRLSRSIKKLNRAALAISVLIFLIISIPLVFSVANEPTAARSLALVPSEIQSIDEIIKSIAWAGLSLVWTTRDHHPLVIGRLPVLNAIQIVLVLFGIWAMWYHARRELWLLLGLFVLGILATGVNNDLTYLILCLPSLGILSAAGLRYLYKEWKNVFPVNPLPRTLAVMLMFSIVGLHLVIGIRYSLIAWPATVATRSTYMIK